MLPPEVAVRVAERGDLPALAEIYAGYVGCSVATFDLEPLTVSQWEASWETAAAAGHPWWVGVGAAGVQGYLMTGPFMVKPAYATTVATTIYLRSDATGRGLGRRLYARALPELARLRFHRAVAGITLPNPASVALHERVGFSRVGVFDEVGHKLGGWRSVGWWQLAL